jgi:hypothetical protein
MQRSPVVDDKDHPGFPLDSDRLDEFEELLYSIEGKPTTRQSGTKNATIEPNNVMRCWSSGFQDRRQEPSSRA